MLARLGLQIHQVLVGLVKDLDLGIQVRHGPHSGHSGCPSPGGMMVVAVMTKMFESSIHIYLEYM